MDYWIIWAYMSLRERDLPLKYTLFVMNLMTGAVMPI